MEVRGIDYQTGEPLLLEIKNGTIVKVVPLSNDEGKHLPFIAPGLFDLQVNGYKGVDFNTTDVTITAVKYLVEALWEQGVTSFFPTLITNTDNATTQALQVIVSACKTFPEVEQSVGGIHLEGPFISREDGPRGAHNAAYIRPPDWDLFARWQEAAEGRIRIVTISPEWPGSKEFISRCVECGVKVSIGHTAASPGQILEAIDAGASMSTHLGNGSHLLLPRHPNYIWEQLASENLWSTIIADGFHLPDAVMKVFLKVKPDKTILVSDATSFAGLSPGVYSGHIGGTVELSREGRLFIQESPQFLAGSAQDLLWCVNSLVKKEILSLKEAWNMASQKPREFLTRSTVHAFQLGTAADLVLFNKSEKGIEITQTIKSGITVFQKY